MDGFQCLVRRATTFDDSCLCRSLVGSNTDRAPLRVEGRVVAGQQGHSEDIEWHVNSLDIDETEGCCVRQYVIFGKNFKPL